MRKLKDRVSLKALKSSPESAWIVDVAIIHSAGERLHCALIQDLKTEKVRGWATANDFDSSLIMQALKVACSRSLRTRPATLYLKADYLTPTPAVIAALSCMEFQLRHIESDEEFLLKPLEIILKNLQTRFTEAGGTSINDDWFD